MTYVSSPNTGQRALHLGTLAVFAIAQPLFDLLVRTPTFLVAHRVDASGILVLVAVLAIGVPGLLVLGIAAARVLGSRAQGVIHHGLVAVLIAAIALPPLARGLAGQTTAPFLAAVVLAGGITWSYARLPVLRTFFTVLSIAWILFPVLFLTDGTISRLLRSGAVANSGVGVETDVPVILVVFDELPVLSLLDENREIDAVRYPNFAALARESTWFRNASTVASSTDLAVPAILTGLYPEPGSMPILIDHPQNLFTMLEGAYEQRVFETLTQMAPQPADTPIDTETNDSPEDSLRPFFTDLGIVYLHVLLPEATTGWLPSVTHTWGNFSQASEPHQNQDIVDDAAGSGATRKEQLLGVTKAGQVAYKSRVLDFDHFVESINSDRGVLYFVHSALPHVPWMYSPSGRQYSMHSMKYMHGQQPNGEMWKDDEWAVLQGYQRHLLQLSLVDALLGRLLEQLDSTGIGDDVLLVVTADHGASFWPGYSRRDAELARYPNDVLDIPLFFKLPGQSVGEVSDRHVRTVDILPTIMDILEAPLPRPVDGHSVFDHPMDSPPTKRVLSAAGSWFEFPADMPPELPSLERKLMHFGSGRGGKDLFSIGPYPELIGHPTRRALSRVEPSGEVTLSKDFIAFALSLDRTRVPAMIHGELKLDAAPTERPVIAIAWNNVICSVVPTLVAEGTVHPFCAILPEGACRPGDNVLRFFQVRQGASGPELIPVRTRPVTMQVPAPGPRYRTE